MPDLSTAFADAGDDASHAGVLQTRPSLEACGIDVYTTVRANGYPIEVLKTAECKGNYYGIVLFE